MPTSGTIRVVITGMGWVTPLGDTIEGVWRRLLSGDSGVVPITHFPASAMATNFAAQTPDVSLAQRFADPAPYIGVGLNTRFALTAAANAWKNAGLGDVSTPGASRAGCAHTPTERVGAYLGSGEGPPDFPAFSATNLAGWREETRAVDTRAWANAAYQNMSARCEVEQEPNMPLSHIAQAFAAYGPTYNCLTACAASTQAIGEASEIIRRDEADVMIVGGAHTMIHPLGVTGFIRLTALSSRAGDPARACRPFSLDRDGFVMGEGAGILILESLEHAQARNAQPLAEIVGFGSSADAFRITDIQPDGLGAKASMAHALQQAHINPHTTDESGRPPIHYISAHGTGTKENDSIETTGIKAVFADNAYKIPISSIKSMMGHLIAAAGAVEAITCVQTIRTGFVPPTINYTIPDPVCDLDYVPNQARDLNQTGGVKIALSNSFGFGGQNNTLIIKRFEP